MRKRLLIVPILLLLPLAALADDTTQTSADSSMLGPQGTQSGGSSSADAGALQPAGTTPLQSTTNDSSGLASPNGSSLQAPATADQALKVLSGEADGAPHDPGATTPNLWLMFSIIILIMLGAGVIWRDRRRFRLSDPHHH